MSELSLPAVPQKKDWTLTPRALDRLLAWLDESFYIDQQGIVHAADKRGGEATSADPIIP